VARFLRIRITGLQKTQRILDGLGNRAPKEFGGALFREGERIMGKAKSPENVPVDTGNLRASGFVELPVFRGVNPSVELGFGGPAAGYAVFVHENLRANHPKGRAKYLEIPFNESISNFDDRIADDLRRRFPEVS